MTTTKGAFGATLAAITLLTTAAAMAAPGVATSSVNVRTGPGTGYAKVGALSAGEHVDIKQCQGGWCFVDREGGTDGWVSQNFLAAGNGNNSNSSDELPFNFGVTVGPGGPSISFGIGDGPLPAPIPVPPPPVAAEVCFYKNMGFSGAEQCVAAGDVEQQLTGSWDDRISSIKLIGGAQVQICEEWWSGGSCIVITESKPNLGWFNDKTSSYQTWH